jgi:hypothetical protein
LSVIKPTVSFSAGEGDGLALGAVEAGAAELGAAELGAADAAADASALGDALVPVLPVLQAIRVNARMTTRSMAAILFMFILLK